MRDLWYADRPLVDAAERVRLLERFPELQPNEEGINDVGASVWHVGSIDRDGGAGPASPVVLRDRVPA
ncbi:hypothetical protein ABT237_27240 [Streptomyces sp. NPDC001581]|uniref:hypothetical protein n=1 Tax=Streptomyces sp. NPDC001581 TaxID=3154386 RepID=UPI003327DBE9